MKNLVIIPTFLTLASCASMNRYSEPLRVSTDNISGARFISSNKMHLDNDLSFTRKVEWDIYLITKGDVKATKFRYKVESGDALHANRVALKCGNNESITFNGRSWSKDFDVSCTKYGCTTTEHGEFAIDNKAAEKVLSCKDNLIVQITGRGQKEEKLTLADDKRFFNGMTDILNELRSRRPANK